MVDVFSFRSRLLQLTLLPILLAVVILATLLTAISWKEVDVAIVNKGEATGLQIAQLIAPVMSRELSDERLKEILDFGLSAALEETSIRSISIYNANEGLVVHQGPQFLITRSGQLSEYSKEPIVTLDSTLFTQAVRAADSKTIYGWVKVEVSHDRYTAQRYRMALIIFSVSTIALLAGFSLVIYSNSRVYKPLAMIKSSLDNIAAGKYDIDLDIPKGWAFQDIARLVRKTAENLKQSQHEMHESSEQTTADLQQSLDTVEIQNIQLSMARKEAIEASRAKSEFLANTSHEIRTPINGILGFAGLLLKTRLNAQQKEYLQTIQKSSQGLLAIINDIIDVSKMETGQLALDYAPFNVRDELEDTLQILAPTALDKNLQLISIVKANVPVYLQGDALRLKQIFSNLISNAIKFSESGNIVVRVETLENDENSATLKFYVEDQGVGITPEQQRKLFTAFTQADASNSRSQGGAGLGLAVAKGLIEKMQGSVSVSSKPGEGSTFWFTAKFGINKNIANVVNYQKLAGKRVLICDDNSMVVEQLKSYFDRWKLEYIVVNTEGGMVNAIENRAPNQPIHCVLWDIGSRENLKSWIDNNKALQGFKEKQQCNILLLTTHATDIDYEENEEESCVSFVPKPLKHDELYQKLCEITAEESDIVATESVTHKHQPRILAVDDNPANLQLIGELLKDLGAEVTLAKDGPQALALYQPRLFDMIFMDIQMPGIDGLETTRRIRKQETSENRTPVVALTAHSMSDQKAQLLLAGLDDYLNKPVTESQLIHVIQRWTQKTTRSKSANNASDDAIAPALKSNDTSAPPVDLSLCLQLSSNKPTLARDMLTMLLNNLPDDLEKITGLYKEKDYQTLATVVHKLNGGASYCGTIRLKMACARVEELLIQERLDILHHPMTVLLEAIAQLINWHAEIDLDVLFDLDESLVG